MRIDIFNRTNADIREMDIEKIIREVVAGTRRELPEELADIFTITIRVESDRLLAIVDWSEET